MDGTDAWVDLLDPTDAELDVLLPASIHDRALDQLRSPSVHDDEPRPKLEAHGDYVFGVFLVAVVDHSGAMHYQELDLVMTRERLITLRKTPSNGQAPYDIGPAWASCRAQDSIGAVVHHIVDDIAERYLTMIDNLDEAIEELEDGLETLDGVTIRRRIADLKRDILEIRRTLGPFRDLVRRVVDNRVEFDGEEVFTRDVELSFASAYDKFLRASEGLEVSRDLLAGVRDYYQTLLSNRQNEIGQKMAAIASMLLLPTFIVGLYGQNFVDIPELRWHLGYAFSWGLIVAVTVGQYVYFRSKRWL